MKSTAPTQPAAISPKEKKKTKTNKMPPNIRTVLDKRIASLKLKPVPGKVKSQDKPASQIGDSHDSDGSVKSESENEADNPVTENDTLGEISFQNRMVALEKKSEVQHRFIVLRLYVFTTKQEKLKLL